MKMFQNIARQHFRPNRQFSTSIRLNSRKIRIAICGAAGNVGRVVSFCLKKSIHNLELSLFDISTTLKGLTEQLSLMNTQNSIENHMGSLQLRNALKVNLNSKMLLTTYIVLRQNADIVTVLVKNKSPNIKSALQIDDFEQNFPSVATIAKCCMETCPEVSLFALI